MTTLKISEGYTVQFPMVKHAAEVGWTVADAGRGRVASATAGQDMLFSDVLEAKLLEFNPWLSEDAGSLDRRHHRGHPADDRGQPRECSPGCAANASGTTRTRSAIARSRLIDFDNPDEQRPARHLGMEDRAPRPQGQPRRRHLRGQRHPGRDRRAQEPQGRRRAERAIKQLRRYEIETPELLAAPQLFNVTHLLGLLVRRHLERHRAASSASGSRRQTRSTASPFRPSSSRRDFLRTLQHWILFYVEDGETRKSVLREHQRRADRQDRGSLRRPGRRTAA